MKEFVFVAGADIYGKYASDISLKNKKALQLLILFEKYYLSQAANQTKCGSIKAVINEIIDRKNWYKNVFNT